MNKDKIENKIEKILSKILIPLLILSIIFLFKNPILLKIDHKEAVGIVFYTDSSDGGKSAKIKYKVNNKVYYGYYNNPTENIKKGVKVKIYYSSLYPSISIASYDEIIEDDATIFLDYDFHKKK